MNRTTTLLDPPVAGTIAELHERARLNDATVMPAVIDAALARGASSDVEVADLLADAFMCIDTTNGTLIHLLARSRPPGAIVEFGCSFGVSTLYLASALGEGERMITSDLEPHKVGATRANLQRAGLVDRVDVREGDALRTLADIDVPISLLFLDGWKGLYLDVLRLLRPHLTAGAWVIADDTRHPLLGHLCDGYRDYVRDPASGLLSVELPVDDGLELSMVVG